jgi:hypothetical protein
MAKASRRPLAESETHNSNVRRDFMSELTLPAKLPRDQARFFQRVQNGRETLRSLLVLLQPVATVHQTPLLTFVVGSLQPLTHLLV